MNPGAEMGEPFESNSNDLNQIVRSRIEQRGGRITLAEYMELVLYHPGLGYYRSPGRRPGRGGDFLTSPEASPFFGITLANQMAECWERLGRPAEWEIREHGAGVGGLAYDVIAGLTVNHPGTTEGLRYRLLEINEHWRRTAEAAMREAGLGGVVVVQDPGEPRERLAGVALANEVADAMPAHRLVVANGSLAERYVTVEEGSFAWVDGEISPDAAAVAEELSNEISQLPHGALLDVSPAAGTWFEDVCQEVEQGYVLLIDYGYPATELFRGHRLEGTLRGYSRHTVTDDPFARIGEQDLTTHVDFSRLVRVGKSLGMSLAGLTTQGAFLTSLGLGEALLEMQSDPSTRVDAYLGAKAAVVRLIDPGGLGRFRVLMMARDAPVTPPLAGFSVAAPAF